MIQWCINLLLSFFFPVVASDAGTVTYWLQQTPVHLQHEKFGNKAERILFLNLHENETTSVQVVQEYLQSNDGYFIGIKQSGNRNLGFELNGMKFQFDPNRMFTKTGRIASLKRLNGKYVAAAEETIESFSDKIITPVKRAKLVIAVHNNTNGKPLSVNSYRNKYRNSAMDPDDFVLTTEKSIFDQLKAKNINAVWETTATSVDDGSLAYYCSKKNIPYINIEAEAGHTAQQLKMLNTLTNIIQQYTE